MSLKLQDLQQQLREKFPDAHQSRPPETTSPGSSLPAFPKGALTELSPATPTSSLSLVLTQLLSPPKTNDPTAHSQSISDRPCSRPGIPQLALIDGRDSFDPTSYGPTACSQLLWVRCHHADESLRCTDLLLRDGNLPLLVLDLQLTTTAELNDIPTSSWYRLRNLARQSGSTLLTFTPRPLIPAASLQLTLQSSFFLPDLESPHNLTKKIRVHSPPSHLNGTLHGP